VSYEKTITELDRMVIMAQREVSKINEQERIALDDLEVARNRRASLERQIADHLAAIAVLERDDGSDIIASMKGDGHA
jgi:hypothetical protein